MGEVDYKKFCFLKMAIARNDNRKLTPVDNLILTPLSLS